jgi:hypothetical protein
MSWPHVGGQGTKFNQRSLGRSGPASSADECAGRVDGTSNDKQIFASGFSRRSFLAVAGGAASAVAIPLLGAADATAKPAGSQPARSGVGDPLSTPRVNGLHLQFGADASREVVASWHTLLPVQHPRVLLGEQDGRYLSSQSAQRTSYTDAKSGQVVYAYHARLAGLRSSNDYVYAAIHDGAAAEFGTFRTGPRGREAFTFTSFGDQGTPTTGRKYVPPAGVTIPNPPYVNDNLGSPAAGDTTAGVERVQPLFHLFNGDLCYANLANDRVRTWTDFWENNSRSARHRPWMPSAGNHENELGNGPIGYEAYQTYFSLPSQTGQTDVTKGLWYAFTVGSVRVISLANDDVCLQDGGNSYVRGYSQGAQKTWLEKELKATRSSDAIDWIVVCMHQVVTSTADQFNGADLGIRQEWVPLFDQYGVDLVVRPRASLRAIASDSWPAAKRDPDSDPSWYPHRRDRHDRGHRAHGARWRWHIGTVQPPVLHPTGLPGDHLNHHTGSDDRKARADLHAGSSALVGGTRRRPLLRLRGLHRRSRNPPGRRDQA